jgi:predicted RNase H-like nuclease
MQLAQRFGWAVDPDTRIDSDTILCIEVYPHPAMIGLFMLGYRLDYKKGDYARRSPGFNELVKRLEFIPELQVQFRSGHVKVASGMSRSSGWVA